MNIKMGFGEPLLKDVYGRDIFVGSVVDEVYRSGNYVSLSRYIAYGLTGKGNLQVFRVYPWEAGVGGVRMTSGVKVSKTWIIGNGTLLAPNVPISDGYNVPINDYHELGNDFDQSPLFHKYMGMLK